MLYENGPDFERRALEVARAIHDPMGTQGAVMFEGAEHDSIFISDEAIHAYEFTTRKDKAKAEKDAEKIRKILEHLSRQSANKYKSPKGWFVTADEPTAEQRGAVEREAKRVSFPIYAISIRVLQKNICDAEGYLRLRGNAPFGSTVYTTNQAGFPAIDIPPKFRSIDSGKTSTVSDVADLMVSGNRLLLTGEFGVGKSHALRSLYIELRKRFLKKPLEVPFPVHINLNDCLGLRSPAEILRRHAESIGFDGEKGLISAWRAGTCVLLLDGFDELVPKRWVGGASDVKEVRWQALDPVRRMILDSPSDTGLIICGRSHFFSSPSEMLLALDLGPSSKSFEIDDFNEEQMEEYQKKVGIGSSIPDWIPTRPLLLGYLYASGGVPQNDEWMSQSPGEAWRGLLSEICIRESKMLTAVRPEVIRKLINRVATIARSNGNALGPLGIDEMKRAFYDINGRDPDEEGLQALLRLPGLAVDQTAAEGKEVRIFADRSLAAVAYGEDLGYYLVNPHDVHHPIHRVATWIEAAEELSIEASAATVQEYGLGYAAVISALEYRQSSGWSDVVVSDSIRVADSLASPEVSVVAGYMVEGVIFDYMSPEGVVTAETRFRDCLIGTLDLSGIKSSDRCPTFDCCSIGLLDGVASLPSWLDSNFPETAVDSYSNSTQTTAGILALDLPMDKQVALSILKKVYSQRGSARRETALYKGLDQQRVELVAETLSLLLAKGWLKKGSLSGTTVYRAVKGMRIKALQALEVPQDFKLN